MIYSPELPRDWKLLTVEELVDQGVIYKPLDGNHGGIHPKSTDYVENGIPFVMASDLIEGNVNFKSCKFISEKQAAGLKKGFAKNGDILISHKATIGRTAIVQDNSYQRIVLTPQVTYYRIKDDSKIDNRYLKYYFDSSFFQNILQQWSGAGSTRAYLGITGQLKLPIILPPINEQKNIAQVLWSIDNKIANNNRINQTLEQITQALFKSWFVDFEPVKAKVKAKAEGKDPQLAAMCAISGKSEEELEQLPKEKRNELANIANLFPDNLDKSELGMIPEGWKVNKLGNVTSFLSRGLTPKYEEEGVVVINQRCIRNHSIDFDNARYHNEDLRSIKSKEVFVGDVLINSTGVGTLGRVAVIKRLLGRTTVDTHVTIVRANSEIINRDYLGCYLLNKESTIEEMGEGSTGQTELKRVVLSDMKLCLADLNLQKRFSDFVNSNMSAISNNEIENKKLANIRDTLLPKLLSGIL